MNFSTLVTRSLAYFKRTNLAVILGVATAVAVLAGALLVGDSVRASLRDLVLARLGKTDLLVASTGFFREQLSDDLKSHPNFAASFNDACPLIAIEGVVTHGDTNARAGGVAVYGVDERFWKFNGSSVAPPDGNDVATSAALASEIGARPGDTLVLRIEKPSAIPIESLHSRKDDLGHTVRLTMRESLPAGTIGEFSLRPQQGAVRAIFLPLKKLQRNIEQDGKANAILLSAKNNPPPQAAEAIIKDKFTLADLGLKLRTVNGRQAVALESDSAVINDTLAAKAKAAAEKLHLQTASFLTYLANTIRDGDREIPYSLVTGVEQNELAALSPQGVALNDWAARDLGAKAGDELTFEYYVWKVEGRIDIQRATFKLEAIVPMQGLAADRNLAPEYPGITEAKSLADWDPPFPVDLGRVRKIDEEYWDKYRTTPKAFIPLAAGQKLWATRYGKLTSIRIFPAARETALVVPPSGGSRASQSQPPEGGTTSAAIERDVETMRQDFERQLRASLDPAQMGLTVQAVKSQSLAASRGATDFGEYFAYFSFFLVISALLLTSLFFKLGIEQRLREVGLLRAIGFSIKQVRSLFLREGLLLAVIGSVLGLVGAIAYGWLMMFGLRTWWVGAVGTTLLRLHVSPLSLLIGAVSGVITALVCIWLTLRSLRKASPRSLLAGAAVNDIEVAGKKSPRRRPAVSPRLAAIFFALLGVAMLASSKFIGQTGGFFGAGTFLLVAVLFFWSSWLKSDKRATIHGQGFAPILRMGFRNAAIRPGRSVLCIALVASAAFIIVSVDAFRHGGQAATLEKKSGTGGYPLMADSLLPIVHDPNSPQGREELGLADDTFENVRLTRFRLRPGDDASCLNLYAPRNPRVLGATEGFIRENRFSFADSLAQTAEEKANPWLLLNNKSQIGNLKSEIRDPVPVIADANSLTYVLHLKVGDETALTASDGAPVKLRVVGALADSVLQGELLMSEANFIKLFPDQQGYRVFLIEGGDPTKTAAALEDKLSDFGFDAISTGEKLASFHQVENTYLSTFQTLGGLGLLLGTLGLATVLLRNVLERRKELALLRAVGYQSSHLSLMVVAENALLLGCGLLSGVLCAFVAIAPAFVARGGHLSAISLGLLLLAVLVTGLAASLLAVIAAVRAPLLASLRTE